MKVRSGRPESFGWVRMPGHDVGSGRAYERPDGQIYILASGVTQVVRLLDALPPQADFRALPRSEQGV